jgi:hypothetical protein
MKWMNAAAAATSYPTDGRGAVTATAGSSSFLGAWDNKACVLHGIYVNPGSADGTITITDHDGSAGPLTVLSIATVADNVPSYWVNLHGIQLKGIKVVAAGAACTATIFFDVGQSMTY